jgi:MFS family permease
MNAPTIPLRNRFVVGIFLAVWGTGQAAVVWDCFHGNIPRWSLFVTSATSAEEYPRVDTDGRWDADWRWDPTWERGDQLVRINGVDLRGASSAAFTRALMMALRADGQVEVEWMRDGIRAVETYDSNPIPRFGWVLGLPLSIASAVAAVMLMMRAPHWRLSRLGFVFFAGLSIFALYPGVAPMPIGVRETLQLAIRPLCGAAAILIAARFPDSPPPKKRWDIALAALTFAAIFALYTVLGFGPFRGFVYGSAALLVCFGATMSTLALRTYRRTDPVSRRQIRWVLYGAFVALGMLVFGNLAFLVDPPLLFWAGIPMGLAFAALPVGFLIAVFGYRFLDVDPLISSATSYFVLGVAILVSIETLIPPVSEAAGTLVGVAPDNAELVLAIAIVFLAIPVHRFIRPRIERVFFPERPAFEDGIHQLLEEVSEIEDPEQMIEHVGSQLEVFLGTRTCIVYGMGQTGYDALVCLGPDNAPAISAESVLVETLRARSAPLATDRLSRSDRIGQLPKEDRAVLSSLGVIVVVPIRSRGQLFGFICLGAKRSGDIYTSTELALLTAVANVVSARLQLIG